MSKVENPKFKEIQLNEVPKVGDFVQGYTVTEVDKKDKRGIQKVRGIQGKSDWKPDGSFFVPGSYFAYVGEFK